MAGKRLCLGEDEFLFGAWLRWQRKNDFRVVRNGLFTWSQAPPEKKKTFWIVQDDFPFGAWLRRPGGQGGFRPPPYAPLDPLYPLQTAEGYPRTPLVPKGVRPLVSRPTGAVSGPTFGLAWGQQPIGCRGGDAPCIALVPRHVLPHGGTIAAIPCHDSKDRPAPGSRGRDQLRRRRQWPSQGRM